MKKYIILFCFGLCLFFLTSCLEKYLDQTPTSSGLSKEEVFSTYDSYKLFFDAVYNGSKASNYNIKTGYPLFFMMNQKASWDGLTDLSDACRYNSVHMLKSGSFGENFLTGFTYTGTLPILGSMFYVIRQCNQAIENIGLLKGATEVVTNDLIAQAHFVRAFAHFQLFRIWGPMPYITKVIGSDDQWDIPRLSKHETLIRIAADMDTAATFFAKANTMRRDPGPGVVGNLNSPDQFRPNGVAAKAFKARALLYAASPLNNELGVKDWEEAAKANWDALQTALQYGYTLLDSANYKKNFVGTTYTNEQLWAWSAGTMNYNTTSMSGIVNGVFAADKVATSGESPTQNTVDKFETKWGEPLNTQADRDAASSAGHYSEQNPYVNRDPRFYIDVIYNQAPLAGYGQADIFYEMKAGVPVYGELLNQEYLGITQTGYYNRKQWGDQSVKNQIGVNYTDPLVRLGELYLNYAEAANEAYGPNGAAPNASMTAIQAINVIRNRIKMPNVLSVYTTSKDVFRPRIKNERTIELIFEGHYYNDIRRWKDVSVTMAGPLYKMDIEKVPVSAAYPKGFKYTRNTPIPANHQTSWKDAMYYFPFPLVDVYKMKNFVANESW